MNGNGILNNIFSRNIRRENDRGLNTSLSERGGRDFANASFHSYHTALNRTLSDVGENDFQQELMNLHANTNIVSVLNTPKKNTFLGDIVNIFQETLTDRAINTIKKTPKIDKEILNVKYEDFRSYVNNTSKVLEIYQKNKTRKNIRQREKDLINISESLVKCYDVVKPFFFEENFIFDFTYLVKNVRQLKITQEELTEYLDHVELNLFYQITNRFHEFMDVILNLNEMEIQVENSLKTVEFYKNFNNDLKEKAYQHSIKILTLKKKHINMQKTLQLLELISVVRRTVPTLKQLIKNTNYDYAVVLIKNSEETYKTKLRGLKCLNNVQKIFTDARTTLEKNLNNDFAEKCHSYTITTLAYNKNPVLNLDVSSIVEESFMMDISILPTGNDLMATHDDLIRPSSTAITWNLTECQRDEQLENFLANIVVQHIKVKEFSHRPFKMKLLERLKTFHKQFIDDMSEFEENLKSEENKSKSPSADPNSPLTTHITFDLYVKFLLFYFELYKRLLIRLLNIHNKTLKALLNYYEKNSVAESEYNPQKHQELLVLDKNNLRILAETVEEFYSTLAMVVKFLNEKLSEMINSFSIESITIPQFYKLQAFFSEARKCFEEQIKINKSASGWLITENQVLLNYLNKVKAAYSDKISITPLMNLKLESEKNFVEFYHKQKMINLKQQLEDEPWQPADIPYSYLAFFNHFFDPSQNTLNQEMEEIENADELLQSSRPSYRGVINQRIISELNQTMESDVEDDMPRKNILEEETKKDADNTKSKGKPKSGNTEIVKILKNEIYINGKRYRLTSSVLLLIKIVYDFLHIGQKFKSISIESLLKIIETIKFYNSMATKLILNAGVVQYKIVKTITAKILALSSLCLSFLTVLLEPMQSLIESKFNVNIEVVRSEVSLTRTELQNHINEIQAKIVSILGERITQSCASIAQLEWTNQTAKINIPTKFTAQILANTRSMSMNIDDYFLTEDLFAIFSKVFESLRTNYLKIFADLDIESSLVAQRVKEELEYFLQDLKSLKIVSIASIDSIEATVKDIIENRCNPYLEITNIN